MKITLNNSHTVRPATALPHTDVWLSNLDLMAPNKYTSVVYFYRNTNKNPHFFSIGGLKTALSKALVPYYPYAGRLSRDSSGRLQIACKGDGALLEEAEADLSLDDLGGFTPRNELSELVPKINPAAPCSGLRGPKPRRDFQNLSPQCPGDVVQVRRGGTGDSVDAQGSGWDRAVAVHKCNVRDSEGCGNFCYAGDGPEFPQSQKSAHAQIPAQRVATPTIPQSRKISVGMFNFASEQINALKTRAKEISGGRSYTRFEVLASHLWRCACIVRNLESDEMTFMYVSSDGTNRLSPPLPRGYFGNVVLQAVSTTKAGDLVSGGLSYGADTIHDCVLRIDDEYVRSAVDHLEVNPFVRSGAVFGSPNIKMNNWSRLPLYDADFGWGRPAHVGFVRIPFDGSGYLMPNPLDDASLGVALRLHFSPII